MENKVKFQQEVDREIQELNDQFSDFLHTKGIGAKFRVAFENMSQSARRQREADKASFEAVKAQSAEDNKEFVEFLHTKGIGAKYRLVVENIKSGAKEASRETARQVAEMKGNQAAGRAGSVEALEKEFNAFLKAKGLGDKYSVSVREGK